jgi:hypothetical protein
MKKILFSDQTPAAYRGRNGMGKMSGIEIHSVPAGYTSLNPVTSKGAASDAAILEIPNGDLSAVCNALDPVVYCAQYEHDQYDDYQLYTLYIGLSFDDAKAAVLAAHEKYKNERYPDGWVDEWKGGKEGVRVFNVKD